MHPLAKLSCRALGHEIYTGLRLGVYWDNGKGNGNYHTKIGYIWGPFWDSGKEI